MGAITAWHIRIVPMTSTRTLRGGLRAHVLETNSVRLVDAPGRIHEHVDSAIHFLSAFDEAKDGSLIGDVKLKSRGGATRVEDLGYRRFGLLP
jgi:hypothetical protein